jgi:hypothetical protein
MKEKEKAEKTDGPPWGLVITLCCKPCIFLAENVLASLAVARRGAGKRLCSDISAPVERNK